MQGPSASYKEHLHDHTCLPPGGRPAARLPARRQYVFGF